ncbi:MAG: PQQ-like beta-propeller repeat protein [Candidatus Bathyarchaeota archaeon]|nr:PQQ-like beta-propeller repeat protein [Candidatus Bathyarchaeota archaeon]
MSKLMAMNKKFSRNKSAVTAIALILLLAISIFAMIIPHTMGQTVTPTLVIPQWTYINAFPNPVGVGQTISVFVWTANLPPTASGAYGDRWSMWAVVTAPDGTNTTLGPYTSDPVGDIFASYTPNVAGNYTFQGFTAGKLIDETPNGVDPAAVANLTPTQLANAQAYATANNVPISVGYAYVIAGANWHRYYSASISDPVTVTVQEEPIPTETVYPLPVEYWTQPVSQAGHSNWAYITGDWLGQGIAPNYQGTQIPPNNIGGIINDYMQPPTTAHIAWSKPINFGGVAGNPQQLLNGGDNYYGYQSYETMFANCIIMNGYLYYNTPNPPEYGFKCVDLRTGQDVWYQNGSAAWQSTVNMGSGYSPNPIQIGSFNKNSYPQLTFGQEMDFESPNQHGTINTLWAIWTAYNGSTVWSAFDPFTGNWICNLWNVPGYVTTFGSPSLSTDQMGNILIYTVSNVTKTLTIWNSTAVFVNQYQTAALIRNGSVNYGSSSNSYWFYRPALGAQIDARVYGNTVYNITGTIPNTPTSPLLFAVDQADQELIYSTLPNTLGTASYPTPANYVQYAIGIGPDNAGKVLWSVTAPRPGNLTMWFSQNNLGNGVFAMMQKETRIWMGFSTKTGEQIWTTKVPETTNHMYGISGGIYNGILYSGDASGTGGKVYAYNVTNGDLLFTYNSAPMGYDGYWAYAPASVSAFSSNVVFTSSAEHSPGPNLETAEYLQAFNALTGDQLWNITFFKGGTLAVANGYLVSLNEFDNQIYAFGKGPTQTTLQTPLNGVMQGQSLAIQGMVTDISPGTKQSGIALRFPNGVPAVSDSSQTKWMEYVYYQNPRPSDAVGVDVSLTIIDPNGNINNVGTTHSDANGVYAFQITPDMTTAGPGLYTVIASFDGSGAYWPSKAESTFVINAAAPTATPPSTPPQSAADLYFLPAIAGLFVLIIVVAIVLGLLMMRKRA